ncbi:hypothetical protein LTR78_002552 [Recurvomyces mirabilis]|uniref:Uncharacterized protein n=1 Tax=Recurvomyces mirabilis TaxID=574656 RepID=A0AAE0WTM9_9PEZI|nr:hypothetical protein LTR78_002552 [Recurvomyces mirabilis]KAK5157481.1 hypothetical protein LTS14_004246 [Recurvomyces mirabilis]
MYRTSDPRFRRRLNELGASVENVTEQAQSSLYIFGQRYISPCLDSVTSCLTTCVDASCPSLNLRQRDRIRRQRGGRGRGRSRGRAELSFDFYDDWDDLQDEGEGDGLLGWSDEFDRLLAGSGAGTAGYGAVSQQPSQRQGGMIYTKGRRKSAAQIEPDPTVIPRSASKGFFGRMFGGKALRYTPSSADLQEHPGQRRDKRRDLTEGEALLEEEEGLVRSKKHGRKRSGTAGTAGSGTTTDSYSSRGDIFPSDEEDAIPLDDEFAMVLERRNTNPYSGGETESSSGHTRRGKRPSAGSRTSTRRTMSERSGRSSTGGGRQGRSRTGSELQSPVEERRPEMQEESEGLPAAATPTLNELKEEESRLAEEEEAEVERKRGEAARLAAERGLREEEEEEGGVRVGVGEESRSKEDTATPEASASVEEPSQLPTPLPTDDEDDPATLPQHTNTEAVAASPANEVEGKQQQQQQDEQ